MIDILNVKKAYYQFEEDIEKAQKLKVSLAFTNEEKDYIKNRFQKIKDFVHERDVKVLSDYNSEQNSFFRWNLPEEHVAISGTNRYSPFYGAASKTNSKSKLYSRLCDLEERL